MPRPKSDEKRKKILDACQKVLVSDGLGATTASIAKEAHIATGSLFTYFPTKTDLFNELYVTLKTEMTQSIHAPLVGGKDDEQKLHDAWVGWTTWAALHTEKHKALELLRVSDLLTQASKEFGDSTIAPVFELIKRCVSARDIDYPPGFLYTLIGAISAVTMDDMVKHPDAATAYCEAGFETVWKLLT